MIVFLKYAPLAVTVDAPFTVSVPAAVIVIVLVLLVSFCNTITAPSCSRLAEGSVIARGADSAVIPW
jgi:hypothetical protein